MNYIHIIIAIVVAYVIGALWYSPVLFAKQWKKLAKLKGKLKMTFRDIIQSIILTIIMVVALAFALDYAYINAIMDAMVAAVILWIGFIVPVMYSPVIWKKQDIKLFWLESVHYLVVLIIAAIILVW
jgi:hypothetical protein